VLHFHSIPATAQAALTTDTTKNKAVDSLQALSQLKYYRLDGLEQKKEKLARLETKDSTKPAGNHDKSADLKASIKWISATNKLINEVIDTMISLENRSGFYLIPNCQTAR